MGHGIYYQAIPEESALFRGLVSDPKLQALLADCFLSGCRPLDILEAGRDEYDEQLRWLVGSASVFGSQADAEATGARLLGLIDETCRAHPGLLDRTAYLDKTQYRIEEGLNRALVQVGWAEPSDFVRGLLFGVDRLISDRDALGYLSAATVRDAYAGALARLDAWTVFGRSRRVAYLREDYRDWQRLFREAIARDEAILIR